MSVPVAPLLVTVTLTLTDYTMVYGALEEYDRICQLPLLVLPHLRGTAGGRVGWREVARNQ